LCGCSSKSEEAEAPEKLQRSSREAPEKLQKREKFGFPGDGFNNIPVVVKTLEKVHSGYTPNDPNFDKLRRSR